MSNHETFIATAPGELAIAGIGPDRESAVYDADTLGGSQPSSGVAWETYPCSDALAVRALERGIWTPFRIRDDGMADVA